MLYKEADWKTVKDMYDYTVENNLMLLSDYSGLFWSDYVNNHERYDKQFKRLYKSYRYYEQMPYTETNEIDDVTLDFIDAVYTYLAMNDKRYSELYRLKVLDTSTFSPVIDYNMTETGSIDKTHDGTNTLGQRADTNSASIGARTDTTLNQIEGFNSSEFQDSDFVTENIGAQSNSGTFTKGSQTDTDEYTDNTDSTLTKTGSTNNPYDNMIKFQRAWNDYEFITYIFKDICKEFLLV